MLFRDFDTALMEWRESGGAMNYYPPHPRGVAAWEVCDGDELAERITCTPREATTQALAAGGLTVEQIAAEMSEWTD